MKNLFSKKNKAVKLSENPKSSRFTFINDKNTIIKQQLSEYEIWYVGDSNELLNYYTNRQIFENLKDPIYNRNKENYFWGISAEETHIKRVHSGLPKIIIDTLCNVIGSPMISSNDEKVNDTLKKILDNNNFNVILNQQARPLTLVDGWGAFKPIVDKDLSDTPIIQYYEASNVKYITSKGIITGVAFRDFYKYHDKDYVIIETRTIEDGSAKIYYNLFLQKDEDKMVEVPLDTIPEFADLPVDGLVLNGVKDLLCVPCKYYFNLQNKEYGRSIFQGKLDLFDDLDQSLSQRSQTCRVSTPTEYYPTDLLTKGANGDIGLPSVYNRQFIKIPSVPNGDGVSNGTIQTTQPQLNFAQYSEEQKEILASACSGIISVATLGVDLSLKDNADAQREKEKVTIMTRNNVIDMETSIIKKLCNILLMLQEYMETGVITLNDYDISVKYSEFANPSFESLSGVLTPMFTSGAISTKMYVEKLYGDSLSDEEKAQEIEWLENKAQQDNLQMGDFDLNGADENTIRELVGNESQEENSIRGLEE